MNSKTSEAHIDGASRVKMHIHTGVVNGEAFKGHVSQHSRPGCKLRSCVRRSQEPLLLSRNIQLAFSYFQETKGKHVISLRRRLANASQGRRDLVDTDQLVDIKQYSSIATY